MCHRCRLAGQSDRTAHGGSKGFVQLLCGCLRPGMPRGLPARSGVCRCLLSKCYSAASPLLDQDVFQVEPEKTKVTVQVLEPDQRHDGACYAPTVQCIARRSQCSGRMPCSVAAAGTGVFRSAWQATPADLVQLSPAAAGCAAVLLLWRHGCSRCECGGGLPLRPCSRQGKAAALPCHSHTGRLRVWSLAVRPSASLSWPAACRPQALRTRSGAVAGSADRPHHGSVRHHGGLLQEVCAGLPDPHRCALPASPLPQLSACTVRRLLAQVWHAPPRPASSGGCH
jgi:hypothetical protein